LNIVVHLGDASGNSDPLSNPTGPSLALPPNLPASSPPSTANPQSGNSDQDEVSPSTQSQNNSGSGPSISPDSSPSPDHTGEVPQDEDGGNDEGDATDEQSLYSSKTKRSRSLSNGSEVEDIDSASQLFSSASVFSTSSSSSSSSSSSFPPSAAASRGLSRRKVDHSQDNQGGMLPFPTSHSGRGIASSPYTGSGPSGRSNMSCQDIPSSPYASSNASGRHLPTQLSSSSSTSGSNPPANASYVVANFQHLAPSSVLQPIPPEGETAERHLGSHAIHG
jgi:hypothetical protein